MDVSRDAAADGRFRPLRRRARVEPAGVVAVPPSSVRDLAACTP